MALCACWGTSSWSLQLCLSFYFLLTQALQVSQKWDTRSFSSLSWACSQPSKHICPLIFLGMWWWFKASYRHLILQLLSFRILVNFLFACYCCLRQIQYWTCTVNCFQQIPCQILYSYRVNSDSDEKKKKNKPCTWGFPGVFQKVNLRSLRKSPNVFCFSACWYWFSQTTWLWGSWFSRLLCSWGERNGKGASSMKKSLFLSDSGIFLE